MKQDKNILVTGAHGFIGRTVIDYLRQSNDGGLNVTGCARTSENSNDYACDLTDAQAVQTMIASINPDIIVDCAGVTPHQGANDFSANPLMVNNIVNAIQNSERNIGLIYMSSVSVYGKPMNADGIVHENHDPHPQNSYAQSKTVCERIIRNQENLSYVIMRVANIIGKDAFINHVLNSKSAIMRGDNGFQRDIINVQDIAKMVELALPQFENHIQEIINCGSGVGYVFADIIREIQTQTGCEISVHAEPAQETDIQSLICDRQKALDILGWAPKAMELSNLIQEAIAIHEKNNQ